MSFKFQTFESPIGTLFLVAKEATLYGVLFEETWPTFRKKLQELEELELPILKEAKRQLHEYFGKKRRSFNLPYVLEGTPFQKEVWTALAKIPYGTVRTYKEQAQVVQSPKAVRAVGRTNGMNPLSILLPCHRVIGSNGTLTGYAGGLKAKRFLLELEMSARVGYPNLKL
jgi:methylated-DNA-[protein]-cysteine S-methyltransferase